MVAERRIYRGRKLIGTANETECVVAGMMTENTGRHMLDSGGAYGRNWERNSGSTVLDFKSRQPVTLEVETWKMNDRAKHGDDWRGVHRCDIRPLPLAHRGG